MSDPSEPRVCIECGELVNLNPDGWCGECVLDSEIHVDVDAAQIGKNFHQAEAGRSQKALEELGDLIESQKTSGKFGWPPAKIESEPPPLKVDLVEEGKAIAAVLAAVSALPGHSIERVIQAVSGLVGLRDATPHFTFMPNGKITSYPPRGEDREIVMAFNRLSVMQGDGDESAP